MARFACPACRVVMEAPASKAGQKINCLKCGQRLQIPTPPKSTILAKSLPSDPDGSSKSSPKSKRESSSKAPASSAFGLAPFSFGAISTTQEASKSNNIKSNLSYSNLGIASFLIAFVVGGLNFILAISIASGIANSPNEMNAVMRIGMGGIAIVCLNFLNIPFCLVGLGMGLVALITHKNKNHLFTWLGLFGNVIVIICVLAFILWPKPNTPEPRLPQRSNWESISPNRNTR